MAPIYTRLRAAHRLARDSYKLPMVQEQQAGRWAGNGAKP